MVQNVFSLHKIVGGDDVKFPFPHKDYQRYVFGDDKLAHRFGTDLANALIAQGPAFWTTTTTSNQSPTDDIAVAVLSEYIPTATHSLRNHFVAYLNRHLIARNARPALKLDIHGAEENLKTRHGPQASKPEAYHIDRERLGSRTVVVLADIRTSPDREARIRQSFSERRLQNPIIFAYLVSLEGSATTAILSPIFSFIVSPSIKEVESIAQEGTFAMNECFVQFVLGKDYAEFCQFIRRQDDSFARLLLDYAIGGRYYDDEDHQQNVQFLLWEVDARESV